MKKPGPRRLLVNSRRNSTCGSAVLRHLDWRSWWVDRSCGGFYLHVRRNHPVIDGGRPGDETWHRVHSRHSDNPRLACDDGRLYWLLD